MNITPKTELALRLLILHATNVFPRTIPTREAASALGASPNYLRYVSKILTYRGHLIAVRSKGFRLGRSPSEISITSVLKTTQRHVRDHKKISAIKTESAFGRFLTNKITVCEQERSTYTLLELALDFMQNSICTPVPK